MEIVFDKPIASIEFDGAVENRLLIADELGFVYIWGFNFETKESKQVTKHPKKLGTSLLVAYCLANTLNFCIMQTSLLTLFRL